MKRREFLKTLGLGGAIVAVPAIASLPPKFETDGWYRRKGYRPATKEDYGTAGQVLVADSSSPCGVKWADIEPRHKRIERELGMIT